MRQIQLFNTNKVALVDDDDYEKCNMRKWTLTTFGYATTYVKSSGFKRGYYITLHQFIINGNKTGQLIDHIDKNKLNCQKYNLRLADKSINSLNRVKQSFTKSKYIGVGYKKRRAKPWFAHIAINGKRKYLGHYSSQIEAAIARDDTAIIVYGSVAQLNFPLYGA